MDAVLANLIALYAGLALFNVTLAAILWWNSRRPMNRDLFLVWLFTVVGFVAQGATNQASNLVIVYGFSFVFLINIALVSLIARLVDVPVPRRSAWAVLAASLVLAGVADASGASFFWTSLPVALAVAYPTVVVGWRVLRGHWKDLTISGRALLFSSFLFAAHNLDFTVLRDKEEFAALGFTIAILIVFALSVFAPAVVLERIARSEARVSAEMDVARTIQQRILPADPAIAGLEIACHMNPAEKVGGDYYDVYSFGEESWILLGDVTGHGLSSGLVMLMAQSILSSLLHSRPDIPPAELSFLANRILFENLQRLGEQRSMTFVAMRRTGSSNEFVYSGSHDNLFVYRQATGDVELVPVMQSPHQLGLIDEFGPDEYTEARLRLETGDVLLIATDGVTEAARGGEHEAGMFEEERVADVLKGHASRPLEEIRSQLLSELDAFTGGIYHDDVTLVLVRARA